MSLETELQTNTQTMIVLIDAIKNLTKQFFVDGDIAPIVLTSADYDTPIATHQEFVATVSVPALKEAARNTVLSEIQDKLIATTELPAEVVDYAVVAKAITDTFQVNRELVIATLAKYGAKKGPQLKVEDYADFVEDLLA